MHMEHYVEQETIGQDQANEMIGGFEVVHPPSRSVRFITAVTVIGAILVGLGILSYIASNWDTISATAKVGVILASMITFFISGVEIEKKYFKVGKALQYIAIFIYGGGLFLIDQTFNLNLNVYEHFAMWIIGLIPLVLIHKDLLVLLFTQILTFIYLLSLLEGGYWISDLRYMIMFGLGILLTAVWMYLNQHVYKSAIALFINNLLPLILLIVLFTRMEWNVVAYTGIMLIYGAYLFYAPLLGKYAKYISGVQGVIIMGIAGFMYSFEDLWEEWSLISDGTTIAVVFSIAFIVYLFWLTRQGIVTSLIFICLFILRFYFDTFYDFLPKSVFFIIGGGILIAFGYYLERVKRKKGEIEHAKNMES